MFLLRVSVLPRLSIPSIAINRDSPSLLLLLLLLVDVVIEIVDSSSIEAVVELMSLVEVELVLLCLWDYCTLIECNLESVR